MRTNDPHTPLCSVFSLSRYSGRGLGWGFAENTHLQLTPTLTLRRSTGRGNKKARAVACMSALLLALLLPSPSLAANQPKPLLLDANVDQVLDALDQRGKSLKEFTADVKLTEETDPALGGVVTSRTGKVTFQRKGDEDARIRVVFEKKIKGRIAINEKKEYLLDNGNLTDRDYNNKVEVRRVIVKQGQKINLLKLGEGPFPLPIGQSKEDVQKNFDVAKQPPAKDDPKDAIHLTLKPKAGTAMARRLSQLDVWVDRNSNMPVRIDTTDANGSGDKRQTDLTNLTVNPQPPLKDADFELPKIDQSTWSIKTEPYQE
jgi:outer membrane lipoprotein-sorting protein